MNLGFNNTCNKKIAIIDDDRKEIKYKIEYLDDIYKYSKELIATIQKYIEKEDEVKP